MNVDFKYAKCVCGVRLTSRTIDSDWCERGAFPLCPDAGSVESDKQVLFIGAGVSGKGILLISSLPVMASSVLLFGRYERCPQHQCMVYSTEESWALH